MPFVEVYFNASHKPESIRSADQELVLSYSPDNQLERMGSPSKTGTSMSFSYKHGLLAGVVADSGNAAFEWGRIFGRVYYNPILPYPPIVTWFNAVSFRAMISGDFLIVDRRSNSEWNQAWRIDIERRRVYYERSN